jgi:hypothetical protein
MDVVSVLLQNDAPLNALVEALGFSLLENNAPIIAQG